MSFIDQITARRTIYAIGKNVPIDHAKIETIVKEAIKQSPSAFNSQSSRAVILFGDSHVKFWTIVLETLRKMVPETAFPSTSAKINSFIAGAGTVLFYEDTSVIKNLQEQFALYADNFPVWSQQSSGMLQYVIWTALAVEGLGASLQHYNELIEEAVAKEWNIPSGWKLVAQMPFGKPVAGAGEKEFLPLDERVKTYL